MIGKVVVAMAVAGLFASSPASAAQGRTAQAAMSAAKATAQCTDCIYDLASSAPEESARRGLVTVGVGDPQGGGYVMIMAYTGSRWAVLWEGNGNTRDMQSLPARIAVCMDSGGWTNVRSGPGLQYRRIAKISQPMIKKAFAARLTKPLGSSEGEAWFRISVNGKQGWVQNLRTVVAFRGSATSSCQDWRRYWSKPQTGWEHR